MTDLRSMAARAMARPILMLERDALDIAHRIFEAEPRALRSSRWPFMGWLRAAGIRPKAFDDDAYDAQAVDPLPPGGHAYCPHWMEEQGGPDDDLGLGMSLKDGIACLNIDTAISARGSEVCGQWYHGYDTIAAALRAAFAHERVKGIFIRFLTPGGVVDDGIDEVTEVIRAGREAAGGKPVWGFCDVAASAGYWIASQCDKLISPKNGITGSIGAVIVHWEYSGALQKDGIKVTPIQFGAQKTAGAWFAELSEVALADMQAWVDQAGRDFVAAIVAGRPSLTEEQCLATEARIYTGHHDEADRSALGIGLVDELMREREAFAALVTHTEQAVSETGDGTSEAQAQAPLGKATGKTASSKSATAKKETPMAKQKAAAKPGAKAARLAARRKAAEAELAAIKAQEEADAIEDEEEPSAEDEEDLSAEDDDEPSAEDEEDDLTAEDEEEEPSAEDEEEEPAPKAKATSEERRLAIMGLPEAKGNEAFARSLAKDGFTLAQARKALRSANRTGALAGRRDRAVGANGGAAAAGGDAQIRGRLNAAVENLKARNEKRKRNLNVGR